MKFIEDLWMQSSLTGYKMPQISLMINKIIQVIEYRKTSDVIYRFNLIWLKNLMSKGIGISCEITQPLVFDFCYAKLGLLYISAYNVTFR